MAGILSHYDIGRMISASGIAEGVSNSNWLVETSGSSAGSQFVLTMYERRIDVADLPFFLALLDHLAARGCPVPPTVHTTRGEAFLDIGGKAVALIRFLPGSVVEQPTAAQARSVGRALAAMHTAAAEFPLRREQRLGPSAWRTLLEQCGSCGLEAIDPSLAAAMWDELTHLELRWPRLLPTGVIHSDLFPDNVLVQGDEVTGLLDFYFAANDFLAYDLAVTHAAWSFAPDGRQFRPEISTALLDGYAQVRPLERAELDALPDLVRGACVRFIASRAFDWIDTPTDALVRRKDPVEFLHRLHFYRQHGASIFTSPSGGAKAGA